MSANENTEILDAVLKAEKFLKQQKDLYGNLLYKQNIKKEEEQMSKKNSIEAWQTTSTLEELNSKICNCQKCSLGATRTKFVFGVGKPNADIMLIGEAPGADEDAKGEPFVGRAGQLLTKILEAVKINREDVFICNILKCRPPNNRAPLPEEMQTCEPYLKKQIEIIKPKIILCLGRVSAQAILQTKETLTNLREKVHHYENIPLMVTFHPAALLRNPNWKKPTWEDVQNFRKLYDSLSKKN